MKALLASKLVPIGMCGIGWYHLYRFDTNKYQEIAYDKGRQLTLKYHSYVGWESVVEPMILRQLNLLFSVGKAFADGLQSDNVKRTIEENQTKKKD